MRWALDLGTTNTMIARWDAEQGQPRLVRLPHVCRQPDSDEPLSAARAVPSATHVLPPGGLLDRLGRTSALRRSVFLGRWAEIGRVALERNAIHPAPAFTPSFKRALASGGHRTLATTQGQAYSGRDVARLFLRELLVNITREHGARPRELVITTPVDAYESYRAELAAIGRDLGIRRMRFIDEPVAAALGYGLGLARERTALVIDFGGGTLDLAVVRLTAHGTVRGTAEVLAKVGLAIGGDDVDRWIVEHATQALDLHLEPEHSSQHRVWWRLLEEEARQLKEALYFQPDATFSIAPPEELRRFESRLRGDAELIALTRPELIEILTERGLYDALEEGIQRIEEQLEARGEEAPEEVLMVGGSTLLPGVFSRVEAHFGRDRVRAWQPFEAVAFGAAVFAADRYAQSDFIVHDYALITFDADSHDAQYPIVVPSGTRFPTSPELWKRHFTPTCALGEPETFFKLVIGELGARQGERSFAWDSDGKLHTLTRSDDRRPLVKLNAINPTLGVLKPPHPPDDRSPRLEIAFGVNADRWLCATVFDLRSQRFLMQHEPVIRLL